MRLSYQLLGRESGCEVTGGWTDFGSTSRAVHRLGHMGDLRRGRPRAGPLTPAPAVPEASPADREVRVAHPRVGVLRPEGALLQAPDCLQATDSELAAASGT